MALLKYPKHQRVTYTYTAVDNEHQVGHCSGRIREGSAIRVDICTTMSCLQAERKGDLQKKKKNQNGGHGAKGTQVM